MASANLQAATRTSAAPQTTLQQPTYLPEAAPPNQSLPTSIGSLPSKQKNMLRSIAGLALGYSNENNVGPGNVTKQQDQLLQAWEHNANSDYSQFMFEQGLSQVAANPDVLFNEEAMATKAQWSMQGAQAAQSWLGLSAKDWDEYQKLEAQDKQRHSNMLMGVVELAAGIVLSFTGVGAIAGVPLAAEGAATIAGNS